METWRQHPRNLVEELHTLFAQPIDDLTLRTRVEELARDPSFRRLIPYWGPPLYRRNRVMFRPFILARIPSWHWDRPPWKGPYQEALEQWLAEVDRTDDVDLFRVLHPWKLSSLWHRRKYYLAGL